ncbi:TetR/AcrR family transcriptional regulator [Mycobacterium sp. CVI_P3]|uniref:TetR/AcrR family transcriptional regulator n=1 Tax=Mycobacterium pinniadriaticum TaxID=2994102 RepID=A0ABT3S8E8_9MYCO|nr:TetR/AcrR family transcriptional regulator [Mycobacterium pinniadriaticum]MCX2929338.1 TetR/AcrR family transcriptional regulator [Mycobacterium pinniadriaticum]MCX2935762.1 TetR/AcrR family transcriptional regulator [Mycobacterium pinniadriaticum]
MPTEDQQARRDEGPATARGAQRKRALLAAARAVFERKGFIDTKVSDIVAEAGVAHGTFYTYFDTKESIFKAVSYAVVDEMLAALTVPVAADEFHDRVHDAVRRYVDAYRPNATFLALMEQVGTFSPDMRHLRLDVRRAFVERTQRGIEAMKARGVGGPDVDAEYTAEALGAMLEYTCYVWFSLDRQFDEDRLIDALSAIWEKAIRTRVAPARRSRR